MHIELYSGDREHALGVLAPLQADRGGDASPADPAAPMGLDHGHVLDLVLHELQVPDGLLAVQRDEHLATGAADTGNLRFYQRLGFRMLAIERDAFTAATGYAPGLAVDGIPLRDRVWLDLRLDAA